MLKACIFVTCLVSFALLVCAAPADDEPRTPVPILSSEINKHEDGSYDSHYEGGDGTSRQEQATIVDAGTDDEALEVKGSYKYINDQGEEVEVFYTAGKNGFVPYGSIINPEISAAAEKAKDLPQEELEDRPRSKKEY